MKNFRIAMAVTAFFLLASCHNTGSSTAQEPGQNDYQKMQNGEMHGEHSDKATEEHNVHSEAPAMHQATDSMPMHNNTNMHKDSATMHK